MFTKKVMFVFLVFVFVIMGCTRQQSIAPVPTQDAFETLSALSTATSTPAPQQIVVVTATGMLDLGKLLLTPQVTAVASGLIDWSLDAHGWDLRPGLAAPQVFYMDTGVKGRSVVKNLPSQSDGVVQIPENGYLICGGTDAILLLKNGDAISKSGGVYFVLTPDTQIVDLEITNGFCLVTDATWAQQEYAARVSQAISSGWAHAYLYQPNDWPDLTGVYTTPLNSNRVEKTEVSPTKVKPTKTPKP